MIPLPDDGTSAMGHPSTVTQNNEVTLTEFVELYQNELSPDVYPMRISLIHQEQQKDTELMARLSKRGYTPKKIRGGNKAYNIIYYNDRITVPKTLQKRILNWYHEILMHPGINRTELTIRQHFTWPKLHAEVEEVCKKCTTCQLTKKTKQKYGHLPPKKAEAIPWDTLCIDLIGPYKIDKKSNKGYKLHCMTMIDPATGWFEIAQIPNKQADVLSNILAHRLSHNLAEIDQLINSPTSWRIYELTYYQTDDYYYF